MKQFILLALLSTFAISAYSQSTIVGTWKTIDDETGETKSLVKIYKFKGTYYGKVVKLYRKPNEEQDPVCDKCGKKDYRRGKKIKGMFVISKMKASKDLKSAKGGTILDPKSGKIYGCKMEVAANGKKLKVRGFMGFAALGRTQTWIRVK